MKHKFKFKRGDIVVLLETGRDMADKYTGNVVKIEKCMESLSEPWYLIEPDNTCVYKRGYWEYELKLYYNGLQIAIIKAKGMEK